MQKQLLLCAFLFLCLEGYAQSKKPLNHNIIVGNSLSYVPMEEYNIYTNRYNYGHEFTWRAALSFDIANFYRVGLEHRMVLFKNYRETAKVGSIWGWNNQFNVLPKWKGRALLEFGLHYGNYCSCSPKSIIVNKSALYYSLGFGGSYPISGKVDISGGMSFSSFFDRRVYKNDYNLYYLGFDYFFRRR
jgi:hypothetical protein